MLIVGFLLALIVVGAVIGVAFALNEMRAEPPAGGVRVIESTAAPERRVAVRAEPVLPASHRIRVEADRRPLWEVRGWQRKGNRLTGAFRTPRGSFAGEIVLKAGGPPTFYIIGPPKGLLHGSHSACFRSRGRGRYLIHFGLSSPEIDSGLIAVERLICEALLQERE